MDESEIFPFIACALITLITWGYWVFVVLSVKLLRSSAATRAVLLFTPFFGGLMLLAVLGTLADVWVRASGTYQVFYLLMGMAWVGSLRYTNLALGLSWRDDALERRNPAALFATVGAILGLILTFAGANIGDGPGWWVVIACAFISTSAFFLTWLVVEMVTHVGDAVTIGRDPGAGIHLGGFLLALGILYGKSVAGDWVGFFPTVLEFLVDAWAGVIFLAVFIQMEIWMRPHGSRLHRSTGTALVTSLVYIASALGYSLWKGW